MPEHPFELRGAVKRYRDFTLGPIDLAVPRGYVMGLIGANGAGKTTAIKAALGAIRIDEGEAATIDKTRVGVVLDRPCWTPAWRALDLERLLSPFYPTWDRDRFAELLGWAGVLPHTTIKECSRGMAMKLQIAVALAYDAELLVLDEPTSGLDPLARADLLDRLAEFMTDERHAILFSTHYTADLDRIADLVTLLADGAVIASGPRDDLLESWSLVRGTASDLTAQLRPRVWGLREHSVGWEGVVAAQDLALCGPKAVAETPSLEDLFVHLAKGK